MKRFKIIKTKKVDLDRTVKTVDTSINNYWEFDVFKKYNLSNLVELNLPFSSSNDDFFHLKLKNKEILINQFNGAIVDEVKYSNTELLNQLSFDLHTGYFNMLWCLILLFSSFSIVYFMYSGFSIAYTRLRIRLRNKYTAKEATHVILYGSENGSTKMYTKILLQGMISQNIKVYTTSLNEYREFPNLNKLIILTATYGVGEAPQNASKFSKELQRNIYNKHSFSYSILGFGSLAYPKFCQFAIDIEAILSNQKHPEQLIPLQTVNNKSLEQFSNWLNLWNTKTKMSIQVDKSIINKRKKTKLFKVLHKVVDKDHFIMTLEATKHKFTSGDLLAIYPNDNTHERLYSISKIDNNITLSIKTHELGVCSNYLKDINIKEKLNGFIIKNTSFHYPEKAPKVIMIATGTGIAPFLGMLKNDINNRDVELYFGVKHASSLVLYNDIINESLKNGNLKRFHPCFSREQKEKVYVQHLIKRDINNIIYTLNNRGVLMICGSLQMYDEVCKIIEHELIIQKQKPLIFFKNRKQLLVDCY